MNERPRLFDDLAGIAGGALSAVVGLRDEAESLARAKVEAIVRRLDLVQHEEIAAIGEMAANARAGQEEMAATLAAALARLAALEHRVAALEANANAAESDS
ncbi:MAG: accessory factor UbiK family protein [Acidibrevibacterium sp.]|uniref:accessory factor UbiK family protein n=1 Tax=Acidibrevibacterium sp. TaxID=2606776 RepID=UPI003CFEF375